MAKSKVMPFHLVEAFWDPALVSKILVNNKNAESYKYKFDIKEVEDNERKRRISMDFASMINEELL